MSSTWEPGDRIMSEGPYIVLRAKDSGRLWAYPTPVAEWVLKQHKEDWDYVCEVPDGETAMQMRRLANYEVDQQLTED